MDTELEVGKQVPNFTLDAIEGKVSLSDFLGKRLIIYFYPKDMTPGCTEESCDFRNNIQKFERLNTIIIGINNDDLTTHKKFIEENRLPFMLLSDLDKSVCKRFKVLKLTGIQRTTFLIDEQGHLLREWRKVEVKNHTEEILAEIEKIAGGAYA